jgi:phosphopantothenoylcysteine decarboxylase/phosphopantothenate--cysteine ligase
MYEACMAQWPQTDIAILSAAVADFKPAQQATEKIKKETISNQKSAIKNQKSEISLPLTHTPDIAAALGAGKQAHQTLIGFALETEHEKENALRKLERKNLDAIVLNSLREKGAGFGTDTNRVTILRKKGQPVELPLQSKKIIAAEILTSLFS